VKALRSTRLLPVLILGLLAVVLSRLPAPDGSFDHRHELEISANPADLSFLVTIPVPQRAFQVGELIPIRLSFSSTSLNKYKLNAANYDRSGRLPTEEFTIEQLGVADPYRDYYYMGLHGMNTGGIRGYPLLEPRPFGIDLTLNDWLRFDKPGRYRLYLKSYRLARESKPGESRRATVSFAAVSNIFAVDIIPQNTTWEKEKLDSIRKTMREGPQTTVDPGGRQVLFDSELEQRKQHALHELRGLASEAALRLSFELGRQSGEGPDTLLLYALPDRALAIRMLRGYLVDPTVPFSEWDLLTYAAMNWIAVNTLDPIPLNNRVVVDHWRASLLWLSLEARRVGVDGVLRQEALRQIPYVLKKSASAKEASGLAIAAFAKPEALAAGLVPRRDFGLSRVQLISGFTGFDEQRQHELLSDRWDLIRGPEMIPLLERVIHSVKTEPRGSDLSTKLAWASKEQASGELALRRLRDLDPSRAEKILVRDIATTRPRFEKFALRALPAQSLPDADAALAKRLESEPLAVLPVVAKFGTAKLQMPMRELLNRRFRECWNEQHIVTYFVRVFPGNEPGEGADVLRRAMANRVNRGCHHFLLSSVAEVVWSPVVEQAALVGLDDGDPEVAGNAASVLALNGGSDAEARIWARLERHYRRWQGRLDELEGPVISADLPSPESRLEDALALSLTTARSWLMDEGRRKRLEKLCLSDWCRQMAARDPAKATIRVSVSGDWEGYHPPRYLVAGYAAPSPTELKAKLSQFPPGSEFSWCVPTDGSVTGRDREEVDRIYADIAGWLRARRMSVAYTTAPWCKQ